MSDLQRSINKLESKYTIQELRELEKKYRWWALLYSFICNTLLTPVVVMWGYNWVVPVITNLRTINYWEAFLLTLLVSFIVKPKAKIDDDESIITYIVRTTLAVLMNILVLGIMFILHIFINGGI